MVQPSHFGDSASIIIQDLLDLIARELAQAGPDPARQAWLVQQRDRFTEALSSGRVQRDPASVAQLVTAVRAVRATILAGR